MANSMTIWYPEEGDYVVLKKDIRDSWGGETFAIPKGTVFSTLSVDSWRGIGPTNDVDVRCGEFDTTVNIGELEEKTATEEEYNNSVAALEVLINETQNRINEKNEEKERRELLRLISKYGVPEGY